MRIAIFYICVFVVGGILALDQADAADLPREVVDTSAAFGKAGMSTHGIQSRRVERCRLAHSTIQRQTTVPVAISITT